MQRIDLTTPAAALAYLQSLPPEQDIELPGSYNPNPASAAADAVAVITGDTANAFGIAESRWEWTAGELAQKMHAEILIQRDVEKDGRK